ncbi:MAG: ABC transporter ATP-binding protein [Lachnospiraceae bacterium]|nr:ABC transporter ATP-binding protein [Lachnospiraceae bacterium]
MIKAESVSKKLDKFKLKDISFELPSGYICGLVGRNGSGKTSLLHLILGLYHADSGRISVFGMEYADNEKMIHDRIGTVLVEELFLPELSIKENADYFGKFYSKYSWDRMREYLVRFGLADAECASEECGEDADGVHGKDNKNTEDTDVKRHANEYNNNHLYPGKNYKKQNGKESGERRQFGKLSKGQRLKCQFAFALSYSPDILILDEPTGNFDPDFREHFLDILKEFIADGTRTVILATHLTDDLDRLADYLIYLEDGEEVFAGDIESFRNEYRVVSGEAYKLKLIPKEKLISMDEKKYGSRALVHHRKYYKYDPEVQVSAPAIEDFMYLYSKR